MIRCTVPVQYRLRYHGVTSELTIEQAVAEWLAFLCTPIGLNS